MNEIITNLNIMSYILEIAYICIGIICIVASLKIDELKQGKKTIFTSVFYKIVGLTFIIPSIVNIYGLIINVDESNESFNSLINFVDVFTGFLIIAMASLTISNLVRTDVNINVDKLKSSETKDLGVKVFLGPLSLAIFAFLIGQFIPSLGGNVGLVIGGIIGLSFFVLQLKPTSNTIFSETSKVLINLGPTAILPQLLVALGALFTAAGVGEIISMSLKSFVPEGSLFIGVVLYCFGMAFFTMIMGNGFAAFSTITVGIGIPFVYSISGVNAYAVGALALTAGYCGTLLTPMAANFNIIPAKLLNMKNEYGVIKYQSFFAIIMLVIHIILMYLFAKGIL